MEIDDLDSEECALSPINKAHSLSRRAAAVVELGNFSAAIEMLEEANECLSTVLQAVKDEDVLRRSIELQLVENDWKIHFWTLKAESPTDDASIDVKAKSPEKESDDDVVVIDGHDFGHSQFLTDSLNPNRTLNMLQMLRNGTSPSVLPSIGNLLPIAEGRKLPKTEALIEEELAEKMKISQQMAQELTS